jgi:nucleoside-diphosphate-sugar epimerase
MILLTGTNGFLGQIVSKELGVSKLLSLGRDNADVMCDLAKEVPILPKLDMVIHAAGKAHMVPKTEAEKRSFFDNNVRGTANLLKGLAQAPSLPKAFILISSVSVYGADQGVQINEERPLSAKDPYGLSKIQAEQIVMDWCAKNKVTCGILRLPLLVGANPPGNLGAMIKGIKKGYYFNIAGGKAKKSMVMASDVAAIIPRLAEVGGIYNLTDGYHPSFYELSNYIAQQLGKGTVPNMPKIFASSLAKVGDLISKLPISSSKLHKITSDLTFNDDKAKTNLGWSPNKVLDVFKI